MSSLEGSNAVGTVSAGMTAACATPTEVSLAASNGLYGLPPRVAAHLGTERCRVCEDALVAFWDRHEPTEIVLASVGEIDLANSSFGVALREHVLSSTAPWCAAAKDEILERQSQASTRHASQELQRARMLRDRLAEHLVSVFRVSGALSTAVRSGGGAAQAPIRLFLNGAVVLGPAADDPSKSSLRLSAERLDEMTRWPVLIVVQGADGSILADARFERFAGAQTIMLDADPTLATAAGVEVILAELPPPADSD